MYGEGSAHGPLHTVLTTLYCYMGFHLFFAAKPLLCINKEHTYAPGSHIALLPTAFGPRPSISTRLSPDEGPPWQPPALYGNVRHLHTLLTALQQQPGTFPVMYSYLTWCPWC
ncbi:hypothetical protein GDO81_029094 [Engystomops pustulosus]|uniref:Uncharacterized protein n=1 Tax=Engystomops pustulosus TaxID=76066 RepID=A0AAV6YDZ6_ENGPU|nr:hypothetical protein GDO81_029094 [Engystomops pustulosus]